MPDKLREMFDKLKDRKPHATDFMLFQEGFTAAAVSMRQRAIKIAQDNTDRNDIINKIGALSDIPQ